MLFLERIKWKKVSLKLSYVPKKNNTMNAKFYGIPVTLDEDNEMIGRTWLADLAAHFMTIIHIIFIGGDFPFVVEEVMKETRTPRTPDLAPRPAGLPRNQDGRELQEKKEREERKENPT